MHRLLNVEGFPQLIAQSLNLRADLVLTDIELAFTFLATARASRVETTVVRNRKNARKAYDTMVHIAATQSFDPTARDLIESKLTDLKQELVAHGETF